MPWQPDSVSQARAEKTLPYSSFASFYDPLFGKSMLPLFIHNFKSLVLRYGISFRAAADVGCGTGHFARFLRHWGVPVWGIDASPAMVAIAQKQNRDPGIAYLLQDMRKLALPCPVDLITCNFDVLNYLLTLSDLRKTFIRFQKNLSAGGHLIFDMITDAWQEPGPFRYVRRIVAPNIISLWFINWNPRSRIRTVYMINFIKSKTGGFRREYEIHKERSYPIGVVYLHLSKCGYQVCGIHDAYKLCPATRSTARAVFVAKKCGHC